MGRKASEEGAAIVSKWRRIKEQRIKQYLVQMLEARIAASEPKAKQDMLDTWVRESLSKSTKDIE